MTFTFMAGWPGWLMKDERRPGVCGTEPDPAC